MVKKVLASLGVAVAIAVVLLGWSGSGKAEDPYPYRYYLPVVFRNAYPFPTQVITIPIAQWCVQSRDEWNAVLVGSAGHTYEEAVDPSGGHVCSDLFAEQRLLAWAAYEADYGTWYYLGRSFVDVAIPPLSGTVVTASLVYTGVVSGYAYPYAPPVVRLNVGTWPDSAFPDNLQVLWQSWRRDAFLADYVSGFDTTDSGDPYDSELLERVVLPLDVRYITPGGRLKFVWRFRDDEVGVSLPNVYSTWVAVGAREGSRDECASRIQAVLEIGYIP